MIPKIDTTSDNNLFAAIPIEKRIWKFCLITGMVLWGIGIALWIEQGIDQKVLFYFNAARIAHGPGIVFQEWLSQYGMAVISSMYVIYLVASHFNRRLDVSKTIFLYTICSYGISSIAGDLLKEVLARPRPLVTYGSEILVLSQSLTPAIPSGHATKSVALALPFILLVSNKDYLHRIMKGLMILLAGGVCFSRIILGAHYVSDVFAGIGMGIIGLPFTMLFAKLILKQMKPEQLPVLSIVWGGLLIFLTFVFMAM